MSVREDGLGEESQSVDAMSMQDLLAEVPQVGSLEWIGLRPARRAPLQVVQEVEVVAGRGLVGDRYKKEGGKRQVSLIQAEHLPVIQSLRTPARGEDAPRGDLSPTLLRRNLVIAGVPLAALRRLRFSIGDEVVLEGSGRCAPCSRMREALGEGGYAAMLDMGGILARVVRGRTIRLGDEVRVLGHRTSANKT